MTLNERMDLLEFQMERLLGGTSIDRYVVETKITREQYNEIANLLDAVRHRIDKGEQVYHGEFESAMYDIVPQKRGDYHFCELITELFSENGRWKEVFPALHGNMTKYRGLG